MNLTRFRLSLFLSISFGFIFSLEAQLNELGTYHIEGKYGKVISYYAAPNSPSCLSLNGKRDPWHFESTGDGYYYISLGICGKYLTDIGYDDIDLVFLNQVALEESTRQLNQQWQLIIEDNKYLIKNRASNNYLMAHLGDTSRNCESPIKTVRGNYRNVSAFKENSQWTIKLEGALYPIPNYVLQDTFLLDYDVYVGGTIGRFAVTLNAEKWLTRREQVNFAIPGSGKPQIREKVIIPDDVLSYEWKIKKECVTNQSIINKVNRCEINVERPFEASFFVPKEGRYTIELIIRKYQTLTQQIVSISAAKRTINIQDFLIVSIGDSMAAGEGNPDKPRNLDCSLGIWTKICRKCEWIRDNHGQFQKLNTKAAEWKEPRAHRSNNAFPVYAAEEFRKQKNENLFATTTLIHRAATGASIENGLLNKTYDWQTFGQIKEVKDIVGDEKIDFLTITIGANDVGFADGIEKLTKGDRAFKNYPSTKLIEDTRLKIDQLDNKFLDLNNMLKDSLNIKHILITEYPNSFFDNRQGEVEAGCGFFKGKLWAKEITRADARAIKLLANELNQKIKTLAKEFGWIYVDGVAERFAGRGYCTGENSFYIGAEKSCKEQGDLLGVLHPNINGQWAYAFLLLAKFNSLIPTFFFQEEPCLVRPNLRISNTLSFYFQTDFPDVWAKLKQLKQLKSSDGYFSISFMLNETDLSDNLLERKIKFIELEFLTQNGLAPMAVQLFFADKRPNYRMTYNGITNSMPSDKKEDWSDMVGESPLQEWILAVPNNETVQTWFEQNIIEDIKLTISYSGKNNKN